MAETSDISDTARVEAGESAPSTTNTHTHEHTDAKSASASASGGDGGVRGNGFGFAPVKAEYLLPRGGVSVNDARVSESVDVDMDAESKGKHAAQDNTQHAKGKGKGRNKKRPRDEKSAPGDRMCRKFAVNGTCQYGDECRYSHDMKESMRTRPADLGDRCVIYDKFGRCPFGALCRFGSAHINSTTGKNLERSAEEGGVLPQQHMNVLSKELQSQLRKRTYKFKTPMKRDQKQGGGGGGGGGKPPRTQHQAEEQQDHTSATEPQAASEGTVGEGDAPPSAPPASTPATTSSDDVRMSEVSDGSMEPLPFGERPMKLVDFSNKIYVAPLTTVGNLPFRRIMKDFRADITCGEMAMCTNLLQGQASEWALLRRHPSEDIFGVQIAAAHADQFMRTAELISNHTTVDFVDVNMGCPIDLVCDKGAGSALMRRPKKITELVRGLTNTLTCPFTLKMRTGWSEKSPIAHDIVRAIDEVNTGHICALMIHGRSRLQRYTKLANWDYVHSVSQGHEGNTAPKLPIIGNGDIFSYTDHVKHQEQGGISSCCMLARGALIKPWLPTEIKEMRHWDISATERLDILRRFVDYGLEHWGSDQQGVNTTRRFLLEWLSFLYRYVPVGLLEHVPQALNERPPPYFGRNDLETLMASPDCNDWVKISEMLLGPVPDDFKFLPKHKSNSYSKPGASGAAEAVQG